MAWDSRNVSSAEWECGTTNTTVRLRFGTQDAACGDEVALAASAAMPLVSLPGATLSGSNYTIIIVDRDASSASSPTRSPLRHMALAGVPRDALAAGAVAGAALEPLFPYSGPRPPAGSGCHRYYAIVYQQTDGAPVQPFNVSNRFTWDFPVWANASSLTRVGATFWRTGASFPCSGSGSPSANPPFEFGSDALAACIVTPLLVFAAFLGWRWRQGRRRRGAESGAAEEVPYGVVMDNPAISMRK